MTPSALAIAPFAVTLPVTPQRHLDETTESWLERLAEANHLTHPALLRILDPDSGDAWSRPNALRPDASPTGWTPSRGTQLCPACLAETGAWRQCWRHPMNTLCLTHNCWLYATCPTCGLPFRHHEHHRLRSVNAPSGTCGNPTGHSGHPCPQLLAALPAQPADRVVVPGQQRMHAAIDGAGLDLCGHPANASAYLTEVRALTTLLLHLAVQPDSDALAVWADDARADARRSPGDRCARWGLAPPADPQLRGHAFAAADHVLTARNQGDAADRLHPWTELTPATADGQLGWLADHTRMTPLLTRLVMAATATRRRVTTLLDHDPPRVSLPTAAIPQAIPREAYRRHLAKHLDVVEDLGCAYAALCLARRHTTVTTWRDAASVLGVPTDHAVDTCRRGAGRVTCRPDRFIGALDALVDVLDPGVDYRVREEIVRTLATQTRWYRTWSRTHHRGSHATSRGYAITWLWTHWAGGLLTTSPAWTSWPAAANHTLPVHTTRGYYRRYAARLTPGARAALIAIAEARTQEGTR